MTVTRTNRNQTFSNGVLITEEVVQVDVTREAVTYDLATKARTAIAKNLRALGRDGQGPGEIDTARATLVASRDTVNNGIKTAFTTLSTVNVTTVAQAQTALRSVGTQMLALIAEMTKQTNQSIGVLDNLKVRVNQDTVLIRLMSHVVDGLGDLLEDNAGTNGT